jgi:hypothetical protein
MDRLEEDFKAGRIDKDEYLKRKKQIEGGLDNLLRRYKTRDGVRSARISENRLITEDSFSRFVKTEKAIDDEETDMSQCPLFHCRRRQMVSLCFSPDGLFSCERLCVGQWQR